MKYVTGARGYKIRYWWIALFNAYIRVQEHQRPPSFWVIIYTFVVHFPQIVGFWLLEVEEFDSPPLLPSGLVRGITPDQTLTPWAPAPAPSARKPFHENICLRYLESQPVFLWLPVLRFFSQNRWLSSRPYRWNLSILKTSVVSQSAKDIRLHFFSERVTDRWNSLPFDVVSAKSLNSFKAGLQQMRDTQIDFVDE